MVGGKFGLCASTMTRSTAPSSEISRRSHQAPIHCVIGCIFRRVEHNLVLYVWPLVQCPPILIDRVRQCQPGLGFWHAGRLHKLLLGLVVQQGDGGRIHP